MIRLPGQTVLFTAVHIFKPDISQRLENDLFLVRCIAGPTYCLSLEFICGHLHLAAQCGPDFFGCCNVHRYLADTAVGHIDAVKFTGSPECYRLAVRQPGNGWSVALRAAGFLQIAFKSVKNQSLQAGFQILDHDLGHQAQTPFQIGD